MNKNRRQLIQASAVTGAGLALTGSVRGQQAPFRLKFGNIMPPDHPLNTRMLEASAEIKAKTNGQVDIQIFPASQLGTDATMLSQLRSGGIDFFAQTGQSRQEISSVRA